MDGPTLHHRRAPGARAGLVLLHGVMSHAGWFEPLMDALVSRGLSVTAVDRRGSGAAREREGSCDPVIWVDDAVRAVAQLRGEVERVALFGWCWGARSAILAATASEVDHLILAAPGLAMSAAIRARAAELAQSSMDPAPLPFEIDVFSEDAAVLTRIRRDPRAWRDQPRAFLAPSRALLADALAALPALRTPTTTFLASDDRIVDNQEVTRLLGARPVEILAGGHALVLESPALVAEHSIVALSR